MMRTKVEKNTDRLFDLIPEYGSHKDTLDEYTKICKAENDEIKRIMTEEGADTVQAGGYKVTCSVRETVTMDEDKLLALLQDVKFKGKSKIIKTKKYVDMDALESAIYSGAITQDLLVQMDKCRERKETVALRITKVKEKGGDK